MQLFHAGIGVTLPFFPMTHFGTKLAALERLRTSVTNPRDLEKIELFEVTFEDAGLRILDTDDFGSAQPEAVMLECLPNEHALRDQVRRRIEKECAQEGMTSFQKKAVARDLVMEAIKGKCDVLRYVNKYEYAGKTSYCILQPHFAKIERIAARRISENSAEL